MLPDAIERIAAKNEVGRDGVIKRPDTKMIARAKEALRVAVPNREGKITVDAPDAVVFPSEESVQNQFGITCIGTDILTSTPKLVLEFGATVQARIGDDPGMAVKTNGLALICKRSCRTKKRVSKTDRSG